MKTSKYRTNSSPINKKLTPGLLAISILSITTVIISTDNAKAGAFIFSGETHGEDLIIHPAGYTGDGGSLNVKVCIVPGTENQASMERPVQNAIAYWNKLQSTTSNLRTHLPGGGNHVGFESVFVHELGHCIGIAHPNLASESGLNEPDRNYTKSTNGGNNVFNTNPGGDDIIGSADDDRGDDVNLHWFRRDNNNPFSITSLVDTSTYARDTNLLPGGDLFAVNGERDVSNLFKAPNSEAVMQQGTHGGEIQRTLTHDDVATLRLAMSGIDEITPTADDYTVNLTYGGISNQDCDINVSFNAAETGLAVCKTTGRLTGHANHWYIGRGEANIFFHPNFNWHFNTAPQCSQETDLTPNTWRMISMPCQLGISTPNTVEAVFGDDLVTADYGTRWVLYEYLPASGYRRLELTAPLKEGVGYWVTTLDSDITVDIEGEYNSNIDHPLGDGSSNGKWNLVGTPFRFDTSWADVQVIDTDGSVVTFNDTATDFIEGTAWRWNGGTGNYETLTLNSGVLSAFDGVWVYSKKAGTALRVPMPNAERTTQ